MQGTRTLEGRTEPADTAAAMRLAEVAEKLLRRISSMDDEVAELGQIAALFEEPPVPPLISFPLATEEGRLGFLWALFHFHYRHGLLMAVNHVWTSLARPKAARCQMMAQQLKLPGTGKIALKNVLAAFLQETLYGVEFPPLPNRSDYPDSASWNAACMKHFADIDAKFEAIVQHYEATLDGRQGPAPSSAKVIMGPWISNVRRSGPSL